MVSYVVCHPDRVHVVLFTSRTLEEAAAAIAAQPAPDALVIYASDGFSRDLTGVERARLREIVDGGAG